MNGSDLLLRIQSDLEEISGYTSRIAVEIPLRSEEPSTIISRLAVYNYQTYLEIRSLSGIAPDFEIDEKRLGQMYSVLAHYLDRYAPGNEDLHCYVTAISIYLTFIAHKPLHPPGSFSEEIQIVRRGSLYYCSGRRKFIRDNPSLCRFCVCQPA
ncbi:DUF2115 family protein [Methanosphaerula palustris]|uniref:UPF0305 protein Mpal_0722 n=1 Tax=Methanosphaerula palustris (strain ATCC BAA-1556 / DSM 19958 / E1-9c) TaxID=521011 RepID=B8GG14_METPE|nr:DUF2115 family protein [Methanosphaerula palustris]ACL16088.1 conserved hypothetical protein [Methanosphaerula palustris E1-9c]